MNTSRIISILLIGLTLATSFQNTDAQFDTGMSENRVVIANLFSWPFKDIAEECKNVLGPHGYGGVLVSPIMEHAIQRVEKGNRTIRPWWEVYQPISFKIKNRFGDEEEFKNMVQECNKNNVRVYVDAILNHGVSYYTDLSGIVHGTGGSTANTITKDYPGFGFNEGNFHPSCNMDSTNITSLRICELWGLQDINQTQPYVQKTMADFLNKIIDYGVAGFRVDATKHMWPDDLKSIYEMLHDVSLGDGQKKMRPLWMLEIHADLTKKIHLEDEYKDLGSQYDFSFSDLMVKGILQRNLWELLNYEQHPDYKSKTVQIITGNQDSFDDVVKIREYPQLFETMVGFLLSYPKGIPNIFSAFSSLEDGAPSDDQQNIISPLKCSDRWTCIHRKESFLRMIKHFTNIVKGLPVAKSWTPSFKQIAFLRGDKGFAAFNLVSRSWYSTYKLPLPPGIYCDLATGYYSPIQKKCIGGNPRQFLVQEGGILELRLPGLTETAVQANSNATYEPTFMMISVESVQPIPDNKPTPSQDIQMTNWLIIAGIIAICLLIVVIIGVTCFKRNRNSQDLA